MKHLAPGGKVKGGITSYLRDKRVEIINSVNSDNLVYRIFTFSLAAFRLIIYRKELTVHVGWKRSALRKSLLLFISNQKRVTLKLHCDADYVLSNEKYYKFLFNRAKRILVFCDDFREKLSQRYPHIRIDIEPNKIVEVITPELFEKEDIVLYMGRLDSNKGIHDLLNVWSKGEYIGKAELCIAGSGEEDIEQELRAREDITYLGWVAGKEKIELLQKARIVVLPSSSEGMPMIILEAMQHRCAILAYDVGCLGAMIPVECLVPPGNEELFGERLTRLIIDSSYSTKLGTFNRSVFEQYFRL